MMLWNLYCILVGIVAFIPYTIITFFIVLWVSIKKDISFRILPVSRTNIQSMIQELKNFKILSARGKKYDLEKFITLVEKIAYLGEKFNIKELDLNPIIILLKYLMNSFSLFISMKSINDL